MSFASLDVQQARASSIHLHPCACAGRQASASPTQPASVPRDFSEVQAMGSDELVTVLTDKASYQALVSAISSQYGNTKVNSEC